MQDLITLGFLILLQAVLGFDNLLYVSLESKRVPEPHQASVRRMGIGLAIALRIILLLVLVNLIESFGKTLFSLDNPFIHGTFDFHSLIVLLGGGFILYTAMKEILHMLHIEEDASALRSSTRSVREAVTWIVVMNLVFSFDSILSAMALTETFWVMAVAIVISGLLMIWLSDSVSEFLQRNRKFEVLGLFILFVVGVMLLTEGGHLAHLELFGHPIEPMSKATFYFVIAVLVLTDVVQVRYQKKILAERERIRAESNPVKA